MASTQPEHSSAEERDSAALNQLIERPPKDPRGRTPILYIAPWVDLGGSDKGTIDWFKHIDRERWAPSIITTQPSLNRWLPELEPYAEEIWALPDLMPGREFPSFILSFIESREVKLVHVMNSRLGFDLLPDMRCLLDPPAVVVQLHAEEPDRSGYVRYVASRFGNLVDAFSVVSQQLGEAILDYDVARSRVHVIRLGVDAHEEFNPDRIVPFELPDSTPSILWPGRLVAQKDPLLTLEVVKALQTRGARFTLQMVGEGELKDDVMRRARELEIEELIRWHPTSHEMPRWYRSCELLLMTSTFEGVPYVMYEALAMGVPVVVPALPGNIELVGQGGGVLIDPRDDVEAYANAIEELLNSDRLRREVGEQGRRRIFEAFSIAEMGKRHDDLYESLLSQRSRRADAVTDNSGSAKPHESTTEPSLVSFPRHALPERSVAIIVPCYQHGRYLPEAIQSLHEQSLPPSKIVVIDDASLDAETSAALDELDRDPLVTVIRLETNSGPSVARNRALAEITESYVLPLDADDKLASGAIEEMVEQLERAGEQVGFIYPRVQHFGNRHDFYEPPAYNLDALLANNYCAAASLFDRRVFDAGIRYAEDIVFGHEDWDLVLEMAEHGIEGEAAESGTLWYRKRGFSRVNAADYGPESFNKHIELRHPRLYRQRREQIKAQWAPALSIILASGCDGVDRPWAQGLQAKLADQVCGDFETICVGHSLGNTSDGLRMIEVTDTGLEGIEKAVKLARGRFVLLAGVEAADALGQCAFVEQLLRVFWSNFPAPERLVLATVADRRCPRLALLSADQASDVTPCAVAWRRSETLSEQVPLGLAATPVEDVILHWQTDERIAWRAL